MRFGEIADPEQLAILTKAFEDYCLLRNIDDERGKEEAARLVMLLFEGGARTAEEFREGLRRMG